MSWAAIFDWDGVIIDSSRYHEQSWEVMARQEGLPLPEGHFKRGFGMKNEVIIPQVLGWAQEPAEINRLARAKEETYRRIVREEGIDALPGVREWLVRLKDARIPCAIASSTNRRNIDCLIDVLRIRPYFAAMVTGDEVEEGKPAPDIFLLAARRLGVAPARCVVFEDALVGIEAARAAGMRVVAVTTTNDRSLLASADRVVDRLDELRVADWA